MIDKNNNSKEESSNKDDFFSFFPYRDCRNCGKEFKVRHRAHIFCNRKCFKKDYRRRQKEERNASVAPLWVCPSCRLKQQLPFDPHRDKRAWLKYKCVCGYKVRAYL